MAVGMAYVIANGDIDLSVGSVLALAGGTAAFLMVKQGMPPLPAAGLGFLAGVAAGVINGFLSTKGRLPAFVVTLGMFYIARGLGAWLASGRQLQGFPRVVQSDRAQTDRGAGLFRGRAGARHLLVSARRRGQHPDLDPRRGRAGLRPDPVAHAVRLHGEGDRRQPARRGLCRGRYRSSTLPQSCALERGLRGARRSDLHRLLPLVPAARRAAARARRDRVGDHRRRQHLRRLWLGARRARGRGGHHALARR